LKKDTRTFLAMLLFVSLLFAVSGCGYGGSSSSSGDGGGAATVSGKSTDIMMKGSKFAPADLTVDKGTTVTWNNDDSTTHTVTAGSKVFDSGNLEKGKSFSYTFNEPGVFEYACTIHPSMKGKVTVK